jgi:hypothetical protein
MKHSSLILCALLVAACNSADKKKSPTPVRKTSPLSSLEKPDQPRPEVENDIPVSDLKITKSRVVKLEKDFSNAEDFKSHINTFAINFEAESGHFYGASVECRENIFSRDTIFKMKAKFDEEGLKATLKLSANPVSESTEYICDVSDGDEILTTKSITLNKSYIVSGLKTFHSLGIKKEVETLYLENGAVVSSDGLDIDIKINELISHKAKIVTFPSEMIDKTPDNIHGPSGGSMKLEVAEGLGEIAFELRGLNGGKQTFIPEKITTPQVADPRSDGNCEGYHDKKDKKCFGKRGLQGFEGLPGFKGMNGGDSGILELKTDANKDFRITVSIQPGQGSQGGDGGLGGPGGPGGIGSYIRWSVEEPRMPGGGNRFRPIMKGFAEVNSTYSHKFPNGPKGYEGVKGAKGETGRNGIPQTSKVETEDGWVIEINDAWENFKGSEI